jgi:hypothetical protein
MRNEKMGEPAERNDMNLIEKFSKSELNKEDILKDVIESPGCIP